MRREDVIARLKATEPVLRNRGVEALYLFGSHARGEGRAHSDVDVFVDPAVEEQFGFLEFMDAYQAILRALGEGIEVGYSTREGLSRYVRAEVEREAVRIF
jgi:predicted nucleotidyltransferase